MENYNIPQITSEKKTQKEMKKQCNLMICWISGCWIRKTTRSLTKVYKHPLSKSHSPIAKSSYTYIQISRKTSQKNLAKKPQTYSFFFDILPLFIIFFRFRFIFVMISFQKIQAALLRSVPSTFSMKTYWAFRSTSLYHTKKWTSYPFNGVII